MRKACCIAPLRRTHGCHAEKTIDNSRELWYNARMVGTGNGAMAAPPAQPERSKPMAKKQKSVPAVEAASVEFVEMHPLPEPPTLADVVELDPTVVEDIERKRSVVKAKYKKRYAARAKEAGLKSKVAQRSAWDWLAQTLAGEVLDDRKQLMVDRFLRLMEANGVDHSRWTNRSQGWQGRLRMTGRLALQRVVAESGVLHTADGETLEAPADWVAHYRN